jgi:hypothetical protein
MSLCLKNLNLMLYKVSKKYLKVYFIFLNFVFLEKFFIVSDLTQSGVLSGQMPHVL